MALRVIRLSGYKSGDISGRIVVETSIMTPQAIDRTSSGVLCWSDVRFLDNEFGKALVTDANGMEYRRGLRMSAGRHLFSILTGKKIYPGPGQKAHRIVNGINEKTVIVEGGMSFPNAYGLDANHSDYYSLASLQTDCRYGHFCDGQWKTSLLNNGPNSGNKFAMSLDKFFESYAKILTSDVTLCQQDKNDIYAYCVLQYWSIFYTSTLTIRAVGSAPGSLAGTGTPATFQPVSLDGKTANLPVPTPTLPKDFSSSFRRIPLDYALTNLPTFASAFSISPGYGDKAFPRIP